MQDLQAIISLCFPVQKKESSVFQVPQEILALIEDIKHL